MLDYTTGDIFASSCEAVVNPVNCVGVMGAGLALQFKERFPENFASYAEACRTGALAPGRMHVFDTGTERPRFIVNFPTKRHWRDLSRLEDIASGIDALDAAMSEHGIRSIAIPPLGSGLGGLPWTDVRDLIAARLSHREDIEITVYEPHRTLTEDAPVGRPISEPRPAMNPELHDFFLDPSASGHFLHAELSAAYRRACEQAGDRHELIAYTDEFDFLLEEIRDYLVDENVYPEYTGQLADLRTALRAIDARRAQISDLDIEIRQSLEEIEALYAAHNEGLHAGDDQNYRGWLDARGRIMAEVDRLRTDPDMAPHLERIATGLNSLAHAELNAPHYRALHSFFLDDKASGQDIHSRLAPAYRRLSEEAGDRLEQLPFADSFEGFLDTVQDYVRDPDREIDPEYRHQLTELFRLLRALEYGPEPVNELRGSILQSLDDLRTLEAEAAELSPGNAEHRREAWLADARHILATAEGFNSHPVLKPHAERLLTNLQELADAAASQSTAASETVSAANQTLQNVLSEPSQSPALTSEPPQLIWAGIGSRGNDREPMPPSVLADMTELARRMAADGWHLCSGGADGSDTAFANGTPVDQRTIWLPWPGYNDLSGPDCHPIPRDRLQQSLELAERFHPAWDRCKQGTRKLHARNGLILLGRNLDRPVHAVVAYTQGGQLQGGTAQGLRIAMEHNIPIFNLGSMTMEEAWKGLQELRRSLTADARRTATADHRQSADASRSATRTYDPANSCVFRFSRDEWGAFSNFFPSIHPIGAAGLRFATSEHLYQAAKFRGSPDVQARIAGASSARNAADMGRDIANVPDADWNDRRIDAMRWTIRMKREANPELVDGLLQKSGDRPIVEHSRKDSFWGARPEGGKLVGQNILGRLWMELRQQIRDGDPLALASAWENPLTPQTAARAPAVDEVGAAAPASPGIVSRHRFLEAARTDPPEADDTWQRIKSGYASLYRASGERIHHLPCQDGYAALRDLVAGAVQDGNCPSRYQDRLKALHRTLQIQDRRHNAVLAAQGALYDACARLADLKGKMEAEPGHAIETLPGYTAWLRESDAAVETWRKLAEDPAHKEHMELVAPDMMAPRIAELSNDKLSSIHRANMDQPVPASGQSVYTPSLQPLSQVWDRALAFVDRDPKLLAYAPQFDELKEAVSTALDECRHAPDLVDKLSALRTTLDDSHEHMTRARTASEDVASASETLCGIKSWSDRTGRPIHEAPNFKSCREDADRALRHYEAAQKDPALALHLARADSLGVLAETALPLLQDPRFCEPAVTQASLARQRSEQADEQYSMSA